MSEYRKERTVVEDVPLGSRPVVETKYDSVICERPGMSGGAITALVLAAIAAAVVITMLILTSQQRHTEDQLAQERARNAAAAAQGQPAPQQQQPPIIVTPSQPATIPVPVPVPSQPAPAVVEPTSTQVEIAITSKLLDDSQLRSYSIDAKVSGGTATLSGHVPTEELKRRAEQVTRTVKGVRTVVNDLVVQS
ncbi:MAG TPA: BON domain-containing protein [Blastocatellia bacterium]|nr:BON domain-containing protein [Blastocatellia bacterium]